MGMESWERNHEGGISWGRNRNLMGEESWGSCHEEQSWRRNRGVTMRRNHDEGIIEEESWRNHDEQSSAEKPVATTRATPMSS